MVQWFKREVYLVVNAPNCDIIGWLLRAAAFQIVVDGASHAAVLVRLTEYAPWLDSVLMLWVIALH